MKEETRLPVRKMVGQNHLVVTEYDDNTAKVVFQHLDLASRRMVPTHMFELVQDKLGPLAPEEVMLMAAAERIGQRLGYQPDLF